MGEDGHAIASARAERVVSSLPALAAAPGKVEMSRAPAGSVEEHQRFMGRALEVARGGVGLASPNPMVGAVVVSGGDIVGEGWHEGPGTPHAEVVALEAAGDRARGGTLYVTLEPCSHQGRTPPCAPVVRDSGIARVVASVRDPNPAVDGRGIALLRDSGVEVIEGVRAADATRLIEGFARHVRTGLPLVTLKTAASLDGRVAAGDGSSRWISGEEARADAHRLRAAAGAIAVGVGTVLSDDPALTVRVPGHRGRPPVRVVLDSRGRTPPGASVLSDLAPTVIATTAACPRSTVASWEATGAEVWVMDPADEDGRVSLPALLQVLGKREVQDLLVEGGPTLAWSAVRQGLVDRLVLYLAPKLIGGGAPGVLEGPGIPTLSEAVGLEIIEVAGVGQDVKVVADVHRDR
jgi:diaminohydroxyphosphoribosylaminopyrimidine deaminase/5-amino-6-(5-phosphoribosylamino)uracil reductase